MARFYDRKRCVSGLLSMISTLLLLMTASPARSVTLVPGDTEYFGKLDTELIPYTEDLDDVAFKPARDLAKIKFATPLPADATVTSARLFHPPQDKSSILALLVEPKDDGEPYLYADLDLDNVMADNERFPLKQGEDDNPYILETTLKIPIKTTLFQSYPVFVQYYKDIRMDEMSA